MANTTNLEDVKNSNQQLLLTALRKNGLISRTQLAQETGLSKPTVTRLLNDMIEAGLVEEVRTGERSVGRPQILLRLVYSTRCAVGVELTPTQMRVTLTDMNARPIKQRIRPVTGQDIHVVVQELTAEIQEICADISAELVGVGVAVPGVANAQTGMVSIEMMGGWREVPLVRWLKEGLGLPVVAVNRAHAAAWGERWYGEGNPTADLLYIRLGTIVEAGIILDGRLHAGRLLTAGAIGHMTVDPNGERCACGNFGCLNTIASEPALLASTRLAMQHNNTSMLMAMVEGKPSFLTMNHVMKALEAGDSVAMNVFAQAGRAIGVVVAGLFNLLNFERVVVGGQLSAAGRLLLNPLQEETYRRALPGTLVSSRIEITRLGADSASIGAASLILQDPVYANH